MRVSALLAVAVALGALLAGCTGEEKVAETPAETVSPGADYHHYVALGDSYTAAPMVPKTDEADGCLRSNHNYPSLLATSLPVETFTDVSCGGASTTNLFESQLTLQNARVAPQLNALDSEVDLVTLGMGGNDNGISQVLLIGCPLGQPTCTDDGPIAAKIDALEGKLVRALNAIKERAPKATVLLVGYPELAPEEAGDCPQLPGLTAERVEEMQALNLRLNKTMAAAAKTAEVDFIDVYAASDGHELCGDDPWVNADPDDVSKAAPMHPFGSEQKAVARLIRKHLDG